MKKLLVLAALLLAQAQAQEVKVTAMGQTMPLDVQMLPAGTVQISEGNYYIANYMNTGISIYVQSPRPLKIATAEETARFQNDWSRFLKKDAAPAPVASTPVTKRTITPAPVNVSKAPPVAPRPAPAPVPSPGASAAAASAASGAVKPTAETAALPVVRPGNKPLLFTKPVSTPALPPVQVGTSAPGEKKPEALSPAPVTPVSVTGTLKATPTPAPPTTPASPSFPAADTVFGGGMGAGAPAPVPAVTPVPAQAAPAATAPSLGSASRNVDLPAGLRVSFEATGNTLRYSVMNTGTDTYRLEARDVQVLQRGMAVQSLLTLRDSVGGTAGTLRPRGAIIGTVEAQTMSKDPLTLSWRVRDSRGKSYKLSYTWTPQ